MSDVPHENPRKARASKLDEHDFPDHADFPYDEIDRRLSEENHEGISAELVEVRVGDEPKLYTMDDLVRAIGEYQRWLLYGDAECLEESLSKLSWRQVSKRVIASAWVTRPALFCGQSLRSIAKIRKLDAKVSRLSDLGLQFTDKFNITARGQKAASAREKYAAIQRAKTKRQS